jgi:hypothetical protein
LRVPIGEEAECQHAVGQDGKLGIPTGRNLSEGRNLDVEVGA